MNNKKKPVSFEDIQKKFIDLSVDQTALQSTSDSSDLNNELDVSHFNFDSKNPKAILIAGFGCDTGGAGSGAGTGPGDSGGSTPPSKTPAGSDAPI